MRLFCAWSAWLVPAIGCGGVDSTRLRNLERSVAALTRESTPAEVEPDLSRDDLDVDILIDYARRHNPGLREAEATVRAAMERIDRETSLEAPAFKVRWENLALRRPFDFSQAEDIMYGLAQSFPFPGKLAARGEVALREAEIQFEIARERERVLVAKIRRAHVEYWQASRERAIHLEHAELRDRIERISRERYVTGAVSQQDVLRSQISLVTLHADVLSIRQRTQSAQAMLNALLARPIDAPLGLPKEPATPDTSFDVRELTEKSKARPELRQAELATTKAQAAVAAAKKDAELPDFMAGIDYWQLPAMNDHAWGGMLSVTLPWLTPQKRAELRAREHEHRAAQMALENLRLQVAFQVRDALSRIESARQALQLYRTELEPKSRQAADVARWDYERARGSFIDLIESHSELLMLQGNAAKAAADLELALIDLERAVGVDLNRRKP